MTLDTRRFGPLQIEARTETAAVTRVTVTAPDLGATLAGTVDLEGTRGFDLTARIDSPDSPLAVDTRGVALELGAMTLEARATGQLTPQSIETLDVTIQKLEGAVVGIDRTAAGTTTVALQDRAHVATPTPLLPLEVQAGSRLSYRPELLTLSNVVVTSGNTKVTANGIFGSLDDVLRIDSTGRLEDWRALLRGAVATRCREARVRRTGPRQRRRLRDLRPAHPQRLARDRRRAPWRRDPSAL